MWMIQVFDFKDYKLFLKKALLSRGKGARSRFAEFIGCRSGYITQVLEGTADLSLEQGDLATEFFGQTNEESEFFLLLLMAGRAGTKRLRARHENQIAQRLEARSNLKDRFKVGTISEEIQAVFYSNWQYLAVLSVTSLPHVQTVEAVAAHLKIPLKRTTEIFEYLERAGLIAIKNGKASPGLVRTHLGEDSPMLPKHHINWRLRAIQSIENRQENNLHYSSVISLSVQDAIRIKERLIMMIEEVATIVAPSPEEQLSSLCLDFFEV